MWGCVGGGWVRYLGNTNAFERQTGGNAEKCSSANLAQIELSSWECVLLHTESRRMSGGCIARNVGAGLNVGGLRIFNRLMRYSRYRREVNSGSIVSETAGLGSAIFLIGRVCRDTTRGRSFFNVVT